MSLWFCPAPCRTNNREQDPVCESCGRERPARLIERDTTAGSGRCPHDGHPLQANGWCEYGNGFPLARPCPFVCDRCPTDPTGRRQPLTWQGTCLHCEAYAPGDRYEYTATNPHWQLVEKGPFVILPPEEQARRAREFAKIMTELAARMTFPPPQRAANDTPTLTPEERMAKAQRMLAEFAAHNRQREQEGTP